MIGERTSCLNIVAHTLERHTHLAIEVVTRENSTDGVGCRC